MSKTLDLIEKICRALEEQKLWGIHKDAEQLKLILTEIGIDNEIRLTLQTSMDSDAVEHPREIPGS